MCLKEMWVVKDLTWKISRKFPLVEMEELHGVLLEALVECHPKFDAERGVKFSTYASVVLWRKGFSWAKKETSRLKREVSLEDLTERGCPFEWESEGRAESPPFLELLLPTIRTKKQRRIVETFLQDPTLKYKEIAKRASTSPSYVKEVIHRIKSKIGRNLT